MHVLETPLIVRAGVFGFAQKLDGLHNQIVKVQRVGNGEFVLIKLINRRDGALERRRSEVRFHIVRRPHDFFGFGDLRQHGARGELLVVQVQLAHRFFDEGKLVAIVVNHEVLVQANQLAALAQNAGANRVECSGEQVAHDGFADEICNALFHFRRRFVGERDGDDVVRADVTLLNEIGDAFCQRVRFAAARARENQKPGRFGAVPPAAAVRSGRSKEEKSWANCTLHFRFACAKIVRREGG